MRKLLLSAFAALLAFPAFAQDAVGDDVTKYITNPGFDEDLTWQADGSTKAIVDKNRALSNRSGGWFAADSTGYAHATTPKRKDGHTPAWNGFAGRIKGWTFDNKDHKSFEWTYFGSVPYALGSDAVAIADDGTTYLTPPATKPSDDNGDDNVGALYLRAGWGGWATYTQNVHLPVGKYRLTYWVYNANYENSKSNTKAKNMTMVICRRDTTTDSDGFNTQEWTKHTIDFTATDSITIQFGYMSDGGSVKNPYVWIDGLKLVKTGDVTLQEVLYSDLEVLTNEFDEVETTVMDYAGLSQECEDWKEKLYEYSADNTVEELKAASADASAALAKIKEAASAISTIQSLIDDAQKLYAKSYPGAADLETAMNNASTTMTDGTSDQILAEVTTMKEAINTYIKSQEASETSPADYTYYVSCPWFIKESLEPTVSSDGTVTYSGGNSANYTSGSSNDDFSSEGWYKGSFTSGDQRLNFAQGRSCWNAWGTNFSEISINQDLTGLPNGYYKVQGDLITQSDYVTDQHVFAKSSVESSISNPLISGDWSTDGNGTWTTLTTNDKVIVVDGKLTIGAAGTGANGNQSGWFCATNFKLLYLGAATDAEIQAAINKRAADVQALADTMHYAADKAAVLDSIAAFKTSSDLTVLNNGLKLGQASEAKYAEVMAEGKTLPTVPTKVAENAYAPVNNLVKWAYNVTNSYLTSSQATYTKVDAKITALKLYSESFYTAAHEADSVYQTLSNETAKSVITNTLSTLTTTLETGDTLQNDTIVNACIAQLRYAYAIAQAQENYENNLNASDFTGNIQNPDAASTSGWTIDKGTGNNYTGSGQYYKRSEETTHKYFDSYNSTPGALNYYGYQLVEGLPNGTYNVKVACRTAGNGAYVFAANGTEKKDTTWVEIPLQTRHTTTTEGNDTIVYSTDSYGAIYENAIAEYNSDPTKSELTEYTQTNGGSGRGWEWVEFSVDVTDHTLTIGMTTDSTRTGKAFTGTWFSVVDWSLTLTAKGDNTGWNGPATGITDIKNNTIDAVDAIYNINGVRLQSAKEPGLYIVVKNGKARKVLVK
jgi:hypothetical protein